MHGLYNLETTGQNPRPPKMLPQDESTWGLCTSMNGVEGGLRQDIDFQLIMVQYLEEYFIASWLLALLGLEYGVLPALLAELYDLADEDPRSAIPELRPWTDYSLRVHIGPATYMALNAIAGRRPYTG